MDVEKGFSDWISLSAFNFGNFLLLLADVAV
jgi:hypothetical protein